MSDNISLTDRLVRWGIDRAAFAARHYAKRFAAPERSVLAQLLGSDLPHSTSRLFGPDDTTRMRTALTVSWVYADIQILVREFSAAQMEVRRLTAETSEAVHDHPFERLLARPNPDMGMSYIWQYTATWMQLAGKAFWYLAPERGNRRRIAEIWPMRADRVKVLPGTGGELIGGYLYRGDSGHAYRIDPAYVCFFRYPHPFDLLDGLSPLGAAATPMATEIGQGEWQHDAYVTGKGIPHSVIMLDKNLSDRDFGVAAQRIREDFEAQRKVAIVRGGSFDVKSVGITQKDLELVSSRRFTRAEIDTIFLGVPYHGSESAESMAQADKMFKEKAVYPLHVLIADAVSVQIVKRFYDDDLAAIFEDIRPQDRALAVQEFTTYAKVQSVDEARAHLNLGPWDHLAERLPDYGRLPVPLATSPAFVLYWYTAGQVSGRGLEQPTDETRLDVTPQAEAAGARLQNGNIPSMRFSDSPGRMTNGLAARTVPTKAAREDLRRWRRVAQRGLRAGVPGLAPDFQSILIPPPLHAAVRAALAEVNDEPELRALFERASHGDLGPPTPPDDLEARLHRVLAAVEAELDGVPV